MKSILTIFLMTFLLTNNQDLIGIYEYQSNEASENHYIVFDKVDGALKGYYFGTEDGKGHGVFFYVVEMSNLTIDKEGAIEFQIAERELFETTRFRIVKGEKQLEDPIGVSRGILKYKGKISDIGLQLTCESKIGDCWANEMTFRKGK